MTTTFKARNGRTYRVKPSEFGGYSVVELINNIPRPVRNLQERETVLKQAGVA